MKITSVRVIVCCPGREVWLQTEKMRDAGKEGERLSCSNFEDAFRTVAQLVSHHTRNGCNLRDGDSVILRGFWEREGYRRIGFGEYRGTVLPARAVRPA